jgi:hypothetical protein
VRSVYRLAVLAALAVCAGGEVAPKPAVVSRMWTLFEKLRKAETATENREHINLRLTAIEVNDYFKEELKTLPRPGIKSVNLKFFPGNYVSSYTTVNFDEVEKWRPGTIPMLLRPVLNGDKAIWVDVRFQAGKGAGTFTVEKAYFQAVRLPAILVEKLIQILAARQPEHYDTSKPVPLPFGLTRIWTQENLISAEN